MGRKKKQQQIEKIQQIQQITQKNQQQIIQDQYQDDVYDQLMEQLQKQNDLAAQMSQKRKSKQYYVKGKDLIEQIRKYQQSAKKSKDGIGYISDQLGSMILKICTRFSLHPKFFGYSYRQEMVSDAVTRCLTAGVSRINLDLVNCNPFSYFTQIALNCFRARINNQKKFLKIKQNLRDELYDDMIAQYNLSKTKDKNEWNNGQQD